MIARELPYEDSAPRTAGTRSGRTAAVVRRERSRTRRYASFTRIFATAGMLTFAIVFYLGLMANVTRMNYELSKTVRTETTLVDESSRLDDRIARMVTRERLALLAKRLGMREPESFARVAIPVEHPTPSTRGIAFLTWLK
ncbi:MAG: hypothetical protein NVSMB21_18600 [Vulcanimicrobiaceae bacterium]